MTRRATLAAALAVLLLTVAAVASGCGSSSSEDGVAALDGAPTTEEERATEASGQTDEDPQEAALDWARCMREHGVDVPDPEVDEDGRIQIRPGAGRRLDDTDADAFREAQDACGTPFGDAGPPALSESERAELEENLLAFAACMRENGVDMPDPDLSGGRGGGLRIGGAGLDRDSETFRRAQEACGDLLEDALPGSRGGGRETEEGEPQ